jgi:hypothetical protein
MVSRCVRRCRLTGDGLLTGKSPESTRRGDAAIAGRHPHVFVRAWVFGTAHFHGAAYPLCEWSLEGPVSADTIF